MAHYRGRDNIAKRVVKIESLFTQRTRSFVFEYKPLGLRIDGRDMANVDFESNLGTEISFDFDGDTYSFAKDDIKILRRLRSRKYSIEPNEVTITEIL